MNESTADSQPMKREDIKIEETGTDIVIFDPAAQLFHLLNATAHNILRACNGSTRVKEIAARLSAEFNSEDPDAVFNDVEETIDRFKSLGLIMFVNEAQEYFQVGTSGSTIENPLLAVSVDGVSMFPVLVSGDRVLVKRSPLEDLRAGDVVVWSNESLKLVAHRLVSIQVGSSPILLTTKGDLCIECDPPVEIDRVLGKVVAVLREGGVQWLSEIEGRNAPFGDDGEKNREEARPRKSSHLTRRPEYKGMKVLDLREISSEAIRNIGSIEDISLVLLSPNNESAWTEVNATQVRSVLTVAHDYKVFTGQPELLPEMLEFMDTPLRLVVSGQIFLTAFEPHQLTETFEDLILSGQAYVNSVESKVVLQSLAKILSGDICVVPREHVRWIGSSILGPEYWRKDPVLPLVAIGGEMALSKRVDSVPDSVSLFDRRSAANLEVGEGIQAAR